MPFTRELPFASTSKPFEFIQQPAPLRNRITGRIQIHFYPAAGAVSVPRLIDGFEVIMTPALVHRDYCDPRWAWEESINENQLHNPRYDPVLDGLGPRMRPR